MSVSSILRNVHIKNNVYSVMNWKCSSHPTAYSGLHGGGKRREAHCFFTWGSSSASEGNLMPQRPYKQFPSLYLDVTKKTENLCWSVSWFWNPFGLCPGWKDQRTKSWGVSVLLLSSCWFQGLPGFGAFFWAEVNDQAFSVYIWKVCVSPARANKVEMP